MERHQRLQQKKVDRSSSISIDRSSKLSPFSTRGFGVQQEASTSTPASKTELWENYQRSTQMGQNGSQKTVLDRSTPIQAKLSIGQPGDKYEQEADSVADRVMAMSEPAQVQREEMGEEEEELQMKPLAGSISPLVQREELPEEEELQMKPEDRAIQREALPEEEEELQMKSLDHSIQRDALPEEEEELQMKPEDNAIQREELPEEEEELQMKSLDNSIQREALPEEEEEIQTKQSSGSNVPVSTPSLENRLSSSKGGGNPLSDDVRSFMEPRFGADFSGVRVHTGSDAVQMNQDVNAQAFAHGSDVYFGAGKAPGKDALTAHELTHVVQQTGMMSRSILRREPVVPSSTNPSGGLKSKLTKISADLQSPGTTATATKVGNNVLIKSPGVAYKGTVSLVEGVEIGTDTIKVGIIQTITSTNRTGVYRKDGKPDGDVLTEQRFALGLSPDALTRDKKGNEITPVPPFYQSPEELNNNQKTVKISTQDFPGHEFPETIGDGKLTETKGGDHFTSSLAAKQGSELVHLKDFAWDQDWSMILDATRSGIGEYATLSSTTTDPETPGGAVGNKGLANPENTVDAYMSPAAADAGLKKGPVLFLKDLAHHRAKAPDSYGLMVGALLRSPVNFEIKVTVEKTNSIFGKDTINVTASAHTAKTQMLELNNGENDTANLPANSVYNSNQLSASTTVNLWINGESIQWPFPYESSPSPISISSGRRGKYKIEYYIK